MNAPTNILPPHDASIAVAFFDVEIAYPGMSLWHGTLVHLRKIIAEADPNVVPTVVKIHMPNPLIPDEDRTWATVISHDLGLNILVPAAGLYTRTGPRMVSYFIALFRKDARRLEILCDAPGETW